MDFIEELGPLALGTRIKNLGELLMKDMAKVYRDHNIEFEPRWFTFFQLILKRKEVSVTEIAGALNQTHPAVVQVVNVLEKKKLIISRKDKSDKRRRMLKLSRKGKALAEQLGPLWEDVQSVASEILQDSAPDLLEKIASVEHALEEKTTYQRMSKKRIKRSLNNIHFIEFEDKYLHAFQQLNEDWLRGYLEITESDRRQLADPVNEIIKKNGSITLVISGETVVGTYALQNLNEQDCELSKFTVSKKFRGMGLGERMLEQAILQAKDKGYQSILLFTHHKLIEATHLYQKRAFKEIEEHPDMQDETGRCSKMMQLIINP